MPNMFHYRPINGLARCLFLSVLVCGPASVYAVDVRVLHSLLDGVLARSVRDGYVNYPEIARNARFYKYIDAIAEFDVDTLDSDQARLVFWINAYNALAIKSVVEGITPINAIGRLKFFRTTEHRVAGRNLDLRSIERDIVLKLQEPRAHFALVPASYSGPPLRSEAYSVEKLEQQLNDNVRVFINDNRKNRFSGAARKAKISEIFEWYRDDFGKSDQAILDFMAKYVADESKAKELQSGRFKVTFMEYDWSINGRPM
jgi:hypothetical protein